MATLDYNTYINALNEANTQRQQQLKDMQAAEDARLRAASQAQIDTINSQRETVEQDFKDSAKDAYTQYMQAKRTLPQQLAAQGYNGGLSESSKIALENQYGKNYNQSYRDRNNSMRALDNQVNQINAALSSALAQNAQNYNQILSDEAYSLNQQLAELKAQQKAAQLASQVSSYNNEKTSSNNTSTSPLSVTQREDYYTPFAVNKAKEVAKEVERANKKKNSLNYWLNADHYLNGPGEQGLKQKLLADRLIRDFEEELIDETELRRLASKYGIYVS